MPQLDLGWELHFLLSGRINEEEYKFPAMWPLPQTFQTAPFWFEGFVEI